MTEANQTTDLQQRQAWLAELCTIAQEVSARAALSDDEAQALIDEAGSIVSGDRGLPTHQDEVKR